MEFDIVKANINHIQQVGELFDLYRQFYKYVSNINESTDYISERMKNNESIIFISTNKQKEAMGFVQLYETFGSLHLGKIIILYDLFVKKECRKYGIGNKLMKKSEEYAKSIGAKGIELSTAKDNLTAQSLYKKIGYIRDNEFYSYSFEL
jgi:ribosomal protein S18 acetylase RimI-like enzyme